MLLCACRAPLYRQRRRGEHQKHTNPEDDLQLILIGCIIGQIHLICSCGQNRLDVSPWTGRQRHRVAFLGVFSVAEFARPASVIRFIQGDFGLMLNLNPVRHLAEPAVREWGVL